MAKRKTPKYIALGEGLEDGETVQVYAGQRFDTAMQHVHSAINQGLLKNPRVYCCEDDTYSYPYDMYKGETKAYLEKRARSRLRRANWSPRAVFRRLVGDDPTWSDLVGFLISFVTFACLAAAVVGIVIFYVVVPIVTWVSSLLAARAGH